MSVVAERGIDTSLSGRPENAGHRRCESQAGQLPQARDLYSGKGVTAVRRPGRVRGHEQAWGRVLRTPGRARVRGCSVRVGVRRWPALVALGITVFAVVVGLGLFAGATAAPIPERTAVVVVQPGQTAWDLARRFAPSSDTAAVVRRIVGLNDLPAATVEAGTPLVVPSGGPVTVPSGR